jgi:hypothetical protein
MHRPLQNSVFGNSGLPVYVSYDTTIHNQSDPQRCSRYIVCDRDNFNGVSLTLYLSNLVIFQGKQGNTRNKDSHCFFTKMPHCFFTEMPHCPPYFFLQGRKMFVYTKVIYRMNLEKAFSQHSRDRTTPLFNKMKNTSLNSLWVTDIFPIPMRFPTVSLFRVTNVVYELLIFVLERL